MQSLKQFLWSVFFCLSSLNIELPSNCAESNVINCINNQCRIRSAKYGEKSFWVYCDNEWVVIQRRINGSVNFYRKWSDYKRGFGDMDGEFWIGLDKLYALTNTNGPVELHIQMQNFNGISKYARYDGFQIGSESNKYRLDNLGFYSGDAGNSLGNHIYEYFSTYDYDNDRNSTANCASLRHGAWWYYYCNPRYTRNLNHI